MLIVLRPSLIGTSLTFIYVEVNAYLCGPEQKGIEVTVAARTAGYPLMVRVEPESV